MKVGFVVIALVAAAVCGMASSARADLGWTLKKYTEAYGPGQKSFGTAPEVGFKVGDSHLVVEFDGDHSVAEVWALGLRRNKVPKSVLLAGETAAKGPLVRHVAFEARDAIAADIHQATVDGLVVRADIRNHLLERIAFCTRIPSCSWLRRWLGRCPPPPQPVRCGILDRMLEVDRRVDQFQAQAEKAFDKAVEGMTR